MNEGADAASDAGDRAATVRAKLLRRLWTGQLPLGSAFWWYAIVCGTALNLAATLLAMALLAAGLPAPLAVIAFALPIPYNLLALVAVWRSAAAHHGPRLLADLARAASLIWALAACLL